MYGEALDEVVDVGRRQGSGGGVRGWGEGQAPEQLWLGCGQVGGGRGLLTSEHSGDKGASAKEDEKCRCTTPSLCHGLPEGCEVFVS
jgi:hypothetical protein